MTLRSTHTAPLAEERDEASEERFLVGLESGTFEAPTEIVRDVLVVEPDPERQTELSKLLVSPGRRLVGTSSYEGAYALVHASRPDAIFVASEIHGVDSLDFCVHLRELCPDALLVWVTEEATPKASAPIPEIDVELSRAEIFELPPGTLEYLRMTSRKPSP